MEMSGKVCLLTLCVFCCVSEGAVDLLGRKPPESCAWTAMQRHQRQGFALLCQRRASGHPASVRFVGCIAMSLAKYNLKFPSPGSKINLNFYLVGARNHLFCLLFTM